MLQLRPNCECCNRDLPPESTEARIRSLECTFCASCIENVLDCYTNSSVRILTFRRDQSHGSSTLQL